MSYPTQEYTEQVWTSSFDSMEEAMITAANVAGGHDGRNGLDRVYEVIELNVVYAPGNGAGGPVLASVTGRYYEQAPE